MEEKTRSKGLIIGVIIAVIVIAAIVFFAILHKSSESFDAADSTNVTKATADNNSAAPAPSERITITFKDSGYTPSELTVKKGTVITVKNEGTSRTEFSSGAHPTHRENPEMNLKTLAPGESASYTANEVGTWTFHDHLHPDLGGTIKVTE